jgi:hypothetical protein
VGCHILRRKTQLVHTATLTPLDTEMRFWHHTMLPIMNLRWEVFQHDNARPHTARVTVDFLANQNVTVLPDRLNH